MFQKCVGIAAALALSIVVAGRVAEAQTGKKGGRTAASASYRTLTGKVTEVKAGEQSVTVDASAEGAKGSQTWLLSVGRQTLLLRAGRNNQYAATELGELKKGDTVQAVVNLVADPTDRTHASWWLVVYPAGVTPLAR